MIDTLRDNDHGGVVNEIGVLIVGEEVYYDTSEEPLPLPLVASNLDEAVTLAVLKTPNEVLTSVTTES